MEQRVGGNEFRRHFKVYLALYFPPIRHLQIVSAYLESISLGTGARMSVLYNLKYVTQAASLP